MKHRLFSLLVAAGVATSIPVQFLPPIACALTSKAQKPHGKVFKIKVSKEILAADELMAKGKYAEAGEIYRQAINNDAKALPGYLGLGTSLAKQFKLEGASREFDKVLTLSPGNPAALAGKALVDLNRLQSSSLTVQNNRANILKQAESECLEALTKDPGMPEAHNTLGLVYREQGRLPEAATEFASALKQEPNYSEAHANLGIAQLAQGDNANAISSFKKAISCATGNSTAYYGLGKAYLANGQLDDAISALNTSLGIFQNSAPARLALGQAYASQGNSNAALKEFQESIRIKPENADPYMRIADIREQRGDLEHSIAELRSALALIPDSSDLRMRIADESLALEKPDDAMKEYQQVLNGNPQNAQAAKGLTRALYLKASKGAEGAFFVSNDFESAARYIDRAVQMNPNDMELRLAQAKMRILAGATIDLSQVAVPKNDGERIAYAEALIAQNKFKEAEDQMNMVITGASDAKSTFAVADLSLTIRDLPSAEAAYRKAASFPNASERAKRGLDAVAKDREAARQDVTLADDLARKKQLASAIDKYHSAIYKNPLTPTAHLGLADALTKLSKPTSKDLREAITQYKSYLSLAGNLPEKESAKLTKKIEQLEGKAAKLEAKEKNARASN